jgi:metal-dependent amidase/aminoacylase/carboxypeptidase family protein
MPDLSREQQTAIDWIEANRAEIAAMSDRIWEYGEPGLREYRSARALMTQLQEAGFEVEAGIAGMQTAFLATWGAGSPTLGFFAEYDGTPGNSQQAVPHRAPISPYHCGFPDLHNGIVQFQREHIPRDYVATVNELVSVGGLHPTALPEFSQVWYVYRSPSVEGIDYVQAMLSRAAQAACLALGAEVEERMVASARPWLPNHVMARHCYRNLERVGPPGFGPDEMEYAREVQRNAGLEPLDPPLDNALTEPEAGMTAEFAGGADDVTEFCWHAPTARIYIAYGLRAKGKIPNWCNAALAKTGVAQETILAAARAMAASAIDLIQSPETLAAAWDEFRERTGGNPLPVRLPPGAVAPDDLTIPPYYPRGWRPPADSGDDGD